MESQKGNEMVVVVNWKKHKIYGAWKTKQEASEGIRYLPGWSFTELEYVEVETEFGEDYRGPETSAKRTARDWGDWLE